MEFIIFTLIQALWFGAMSWKFYVAAERKAWEAFIPVYNAYVLVKIAQRPSYWIILYCIPVVGVVMGIIMIYELLHVFKFRKTWQTAAVMASFGLYLGYLNYQEKLKFWGRDDTFIKKNLGEGINSIFFAIVVATVIRSTTFEAYTIPTSSMEKSLMVGDFLFVSKMHYGVRIPMTPLSLPLVHNKVPFAGVPSYLSWPQIPYLRLPAFSPVKVGDPVVFNYPMDNMPVDKKENYVKRCVGTPGDSLEVIDTKVFVNGNAMQFPDRSYPQFLYYIQTNGQGFSRSRLKKDFDINYLTDDEQRRYPTDQDVYQRTQTDYIMFLQQQHVDQILALPNVVRIWPVIANRPGTPVDTTKPSGLLQIEEGQAQEILFPNPDTGHGERPYNDTWDNFGPIYIPSAGSTVELTPKNVHAYRRIIGEYEGHDLRITSEDKVYIDGVESTNYTFEKDYYWMMGDNRHNSLDARKWGYVPQDHIVGKPVFIWMSYDKHGKGMEKIRTDRVFTTVNGEGKRKSYFWYFIAALGIYQIVQFVRKRKK
ncbi:signal peptidase I [Schleiferiaceae bacterium]|nr:signal peptidase I [Schleiferiaceae bacterium]